MIKNSFVRFLVYSIIIILVVGTFYGMFGTQDTPKEITITELSQMVNDKKVEKIEVDHSKLIATTIQGEKMQTYKEASVSLTEYGITPEKVTINIKNPESGNTLNIILSILPFIIIGVFIYMIMRQAQIGSMRAMNFGRSTARIFTGKHRITFDDVAGLKEPKQEVMEIVEFLKFPKKFAMLGAEIPKGVLLVGPAGVGKTMLAKAIAGEAAVPFFSLSASEFVEMFVGVGASRVRDLFMRAKKSAPAVIFIDELDAIGRMRGSGLGGSHDEREQTLNQILVEMDGFDTDTRVIILAATNRPDVLDSALLRPGRFDRKVMLDLPDKNERLEILNVHVRNKPLDKDVDLETISRTTAGFSGADLKNVVNEAAILAARASEKKIRQTRFNEAIEKVMLGPERKSRILTEKEKKITAYHEAGHAIAGKLLSTNSDIHKISIVSRGSALGFTWSLPQEDRKLVAKSVFEEELAQLLSGRATEHLIFKETTTGASNDLKQATKIARDMVKVYGMSDKLGPIALGEREEMVFLGKEIGEHNNYSEKIASQIDEEVNKIILSADKRAREILVKNRIFLDKIANLLLEKETIEGEEFDRLFEDFDVPKEKL